MFILADFSKTLDKRHIKIKNLLNMNPSKKVIAQKLET